MSTVSVWSGGVLPFAHALWWWVWGIPAEKIERAARGSSPWDRMSERGRRLYVVVTGLCVVAIFVALLVIALADG